MEIKNDNHILNIDPITDFGKKGGEDFVQQKNPEMIPKKIINNPEMIPKKIINNFVLNEDYRTDYGKGLEPKIDPITDFGKGISFKSVDGKEWASYEDAMAYNQWYYESKIMHNEDKKGMHR